MAEGLWNDCRDFWASAHAGEPAASPTPAAPNGGESIEHLLGRVASFSRRHNRALTQLDNMCLLLTIILTLYAIATQARCLSW